MATYADPNGNGTATGWLNTWTSVDDGVRQPNTPDGSVITGTTTDETSETLTFTDATYVPGVTYTLWVYGQGGAKRAVDVAYSVNGSDPGTGHASRAQLIAAGGAAGWYSRVLTIASQAELNNLRVQLIANSTQGGGGASSPTVDAVYVEIPAAGAAHALAAAVAATSAVSGSLLRGKLLAATVAAVSSVSASLTRAASHQLAASVAAGSSVSAALTQTANHALSATVAGASSVQAALTQVANHRLVASVAGGASVAAGLSVAANHSLAASVAGSSSASAAFSAGLALAATMGGASTVAASLSTSSGASPGDECYVPDNVAARTMSHYFYA